MQVQEKQRTISYHVGNATLDLSAIGAIFHIERTAAETNGTSFDMEWMLLPRSGGTPVHSHPHAEETYTVIDGTIDLFVDGKWQKLMKGESYTVARGKAHTYRNSSDTTARVYNTHQPALSFELYFRNLASVVNHLAGENVEPLKKNARVAIHLSMLMKKYSREIVPVNPPPFVVNFLHFIGKLRGFRV